VSSVKAIVPGVGLLLPAVVFACAGDRSTAKATGGTDASTADAPGTGDVADDAVVTADVAATGDAVGALDATDAAYAEDVVDAADALDTMDAATSASALGLYFYPATTYLPDGVSRAGAPLTVSLDQITTSFPAIRETSGVILMISWNQLCPISADTCDFSIVDGALAYWSSRGKKVVLNVATTGYPYTAWVGGAAQYVNETPAWVLADLGATGTYVGTPAVSIGSTPAGTIPQTTFPDYWDERFVQMSAAFAATLAARYDGNPAVSYVRIPYGLQGEENPTVFGGQVSQYPAGFTFASWLDYNRKITDVYLSTFQRSTLEVDISFTPWIRQYAQAHNDAASVLLADQFVSYLIDRKDRVVVGYNGFEDTACLVLPGVTCPVASTPGGTQPRKDILSAAMGYIRQVKAAGGRYTLEGGTLLNPDMSGPDLAAATKFLAPERYTMWGGDAASLDYERSGFAIDAQNAGTLKWYGDAIARKVAAEGEALLSAIGPFAP
jgi:hypothetical protein